MCKTIITSVYFYLSTLMWWSGVLILLKMLSERRILSKSKEIHKGDINKMNAIVNGKHLHAFLNCFQWSSVFEIQEEIDRGREEDEEREFLLEIVSKNVHRKNFTYSKQQSKHNWRIMSVFYWITETCCVVIFFHQLLVKGFIWKKS